MDGRDQPETDQIRATRRLRAPYIVLAVVVATCAAVVHQLAARSAPVTLRRFVSSRLPDGSRITFLYPSDLQVRPKPGASAYVSSRGVYWQHLMKLRAPWGGDREVLLATYAAPRSPKAGTGRTHLTRADVPAEALVGRASRGFPGHAVAYEDTQTQERHQLLHFCPDTERYRRFDAAIIASFEVLPPGAPVPTP